MSVVQPLPYTGNPLNRASYQRTDQDWLAGHLERPGTLVVPLWRDACLVGPGGRPVVLEWPGASGVLRATAEPIFLGVHGEVAHFAVDLSDLDEQQARELGGATAVQDVRGLVSSLTPEDAAMLAHARGLCHWHRNQRYCGACGGATEQREGGHMRVCRGCAKPFPRIEPAVITLVEAPGEPRRCLLARHAGAAEGGFAAIAGFVEIGESLEEAVRREVREETGVEVGSVTYQASQAWPFPSGLMVGFHARAATEAIEVDHVEIIEARWFGEAELRRQAQRFRVDSIERFLFSAWAGG
jgi:NAD+ diphosphatase